MIIAAVLDLNEKILPIVEGSILRLYDTESKRFMDYENPALHVKEGRRGAALQFAEENGAIAFVTPPQTFCVLSYDKARKDKIQFYPIDKQLEFQEFQRLIENGQLQMTNILPDKDIAPSQVLN